MNSESLWEVSCPHQWTLEPQVDQKNPLLTLCIKPVALYPDCILEFPREHNKARHPELSPEGLFNSSAMWSWHQHFLKSPPGHPDVQASLKTRGLSSRPDTAERTMIKLAKWKFLSLNWHTPAPSHSGRCGLREVPVKETQGSDWTQDTLCYQGLRDVKKP